MALPADRPPLLEMRHVSKTFGAIRALRDVQLTAYGGQVHVLMGENGAGKSTLMKVLAGANLPDPGGEIRIDGKPAAIVDPSSAKSAGVAIIYQELSLAPNLMVWTSPARHLAQGRAVPRWLSLKQHLKERRPWESLSSICHLSPP